MMEKFRWCPLAPSDCVPPAVPLAPPRIPMAPWRMLRVLRTAKLPKGRARNWTPPRLNANSPRNVAMKNSLRATDFQHGLPPIPSRSLIVIYNVPNTSLWPVGPRMLLPFRCEIQPDPWITRPLPSTSGARPRRNLLRVRSREDPKATALKVRGAVLLTLLYAPTVSKSHHKHARVHACL